MHPNSELKPCLQYPYSYSIPPNSELKPCLQNSYSYSIPPNSELKPCLQYSYSYSMPPNSELKPCLQYSYSYSLLPHSWLTMFTIFIQLFIAPPLLIDLVPYIHAATPATPKKTLPLTTVVGLACGIGGIGYCLVLVTLCIICYCVSLRKMKK